MKIKIVPTVTAEQLAALVIAAGSAGANCARVLPVGRVRASILTLDKLNSFLGHTADVEFGSRVALGLDFKPLKSKKEKELPAPDPVLPAHPLTAKELSPVIKNFKGDHGTTLLKPEKEKTGPIGFMALIDQYLLDLQSNEKVKDFVRSKWTVDQVVNRVMEKFPAKNIISVKNVVKVRPRLLERQKVGAKYDDVRHRAPRWMPAGPSKGTGFVHAIRLLLAEGKHTTRQVAEKVAEQYGRTVDSVHIQVRVIASPSQQPKSKPKIDFIRVRAKVKTPEEKIKAREALKKKNLALQVKNRASK